MCPADSAHVYRLLQRRTLGMGLSSVLFRVFSVPMAGAEANRQSPVRTRDRRRSPSNSRTRETACIGSSQLCLIAPLYFRYRVARRRKCPQSGPALRGQSPKFLDPMMVGIPISRPLRFLARDTLFRQPLMRAFLKGVHDSGQSRFGQLDYDSASCRSTAAGTPVRHLSRGNTK